MRKNENKKRSSRRTPVSLLSQAIYHSLRIFLLVLQNGDSPPAQALLACRSKLCYRQLSTALCLARAVNYSHWFIDDINKSTHPTMKSRGMKSRQLVNYENIRPIFTSAYRASSCSWIPLQKRLSPFPIASEMDFRGGGRSGRICVGFPAFRWIGWNVAWVNRAWKITVFRRLRPVLE